ncbi:glutathione S-transferase P 1-like [Ambystoma mexicanum]|uniref:glutathione S-transferase P 1-like n=1 Tax=Ambystoma mexicanum TaxID=8296 RepID=UPI0037E88C8C
MVNFIIISYFPMRGRAEMMRFLLSDQGCRWTDEEISFEKWASGEVDFKQTAVFGQMPRMKDGDFTLYQSGAIMRYLARKHGLYGKNDKEAGLIDMTSIGLDDLREKYLRLIYLEYDTGKEAYIENLPSQLARFENILSQNNKGSGFLVGTKISFVDYVMLDILQIHLVLAPDCLKDCPLLTAYMDRIASRPKLRAYLESDAHKTRPINSNGNQ